MEVSYKVCAYSIRAVTVKSGGKSAVLSAITIALGGKANSTGRGSGLKAFIREGQRYYLPIEAWQWTCLP